MGPFDKKLEICRQNASECEMRMRSDLESRESHIADLLELSEKTIEAGDSEAIRAAYRSLAEGTGTDGKGGVRGMLALRDGIEFAGRFILPDIKDAFRERRGGGTAACCSSPLTENAFGVFSHHVRELRLQRAPSFEESCESVYSSYADFCILPVENSRDGLLSGFRRMIDRYELYVCGLCRIEENEDDSVKAALLCREPLFFPRENDGRTKRLCSLSVTLNAETPLAKLLFAAETLGAAPVHIDSVPDESHYADPGRSFLLTFEAGSGILPLLNLIELEGCGWKLTGLYNYYTQ